MARLLNGKEQTVTVDSLDTLLEQYGFTLPRHGLASTADEAARIGKKFGFPVVLKIESPDILHKFDVGGVELGVASEAEARDAFGRIVAAVSGRSPGARIEGVRVEKSCAEGFEVFIGLEHNAQFGPTIVFGLGGIFAEVLQDVTFRILPIDEGEAVAMLREIAGRRILEGFRGLPPASEQLLVELLMRASRLAMDHSDRLVSIDFNPIIILGETHHVLDAKAIWAEETRDEAKSHPDTAFLDCFFDARSVAVIGASGNPEKLGYAILHSLVHLGYQGEVHPIHPKLENVLGRRAYQSLREVPGVVDLAVAAIPLASIPKVLNDCAAKGIHNLVVVAGGGKELGNSGAELEHTIRAAARALRVRVVGPNCIGVFNGRNRLDTFFQLTERMARPRSGRLAILTQSGTVGVALLEQAEAIGVSKFVSYGNRIDVDEADLIAYLADDSDTSVILCYIEGLNDGRKFLETARAVTPHKPIVVYKAGRTPQAAKAAISHTGFFGGTYGPWLGALAQAGVVVVDSVGEMFAAGKALSMQPAAAGTRVAMISNGAGPMVQAIDLFERMDLRLAELSPSTLERLAAAYPSYFMVQNPVDVTGSGTANDYIMGIEGLLRDPAVDIVMPWFVFQDPALGEEIVGELTRLSREHAKPILCGAMGGTYTECLSSRIENGGIPVFHAVGEWVCAASALAKRSQHRIEERVDEGRKG